MGLWKCLCLIEILMRIPTTTNTTVTTHIYFWNHSLALRLDLHLNHIFIIQILASTFKNTSDFIVKKNNDHLEYLLLIIQRQQRQIHVEFFFFFF